MTESLAAQLIKQASQDQDYSILYLPGQETELTFTAVEPLAMSTGRIALQSLS